MQALYRPLPKFGMRVRASLVSLFNGKDSCHRRKIKALGTLSIDILPYMPTEVTGKVT